MIEHARQRLYDLAYIEYHIRFLIPLRKRVESASWSFARHVPRWLAYKIVITAFARAYAHNETPLPHDCFRRVCEAALTGRTPIAREEYYED